MVRNPRLRRAVIARDGGRCRMMRDGAVCGRPAVQANHRQRLRDGGAETAANLEAACADCNHTDGGLSRFEGAPPPPGLTVLQQAIVRALDAAGLRSDAGRRAARRILERTALARCRSADIDLACRWRRHRGPGAASVGIGPRNRW